MTENQWKSMGVNTWSSLHIVKQECVCVCVVLRDTGREERQKERHNHRHGGRAINRTVRNESANQQILSVLFDTCCFLLKQHNTLCPIFAWLFNMEVHAAELLPITWKPYLVFEKFSNPGQ
ncbi:hypothetical protein AMECASPLE_036355 [Ameca splendens]|uniref:Uncharacterized protein n=1 Tax=Ameca splendens TaxID=208324 RepID=A0ABV0Z5V4_9TELE